MMNDMEEIIISSLINNQEYGQKVFPYIKYEYFESSETQEIIQIIQNYGVKYGHIPEYDIINVGLSESNNLTEDSFQRAKEYLDKAKNKEKLSETEWLLDNTEKYFLNRSIHLAAIDVIDIVSGENKRISIDALPSIMQKALNVTFDSSVGHDYIEDAGERFEKLRKAEAKLPLPLTMFNHVMRGGPELKTLNIVVAPTGVGKCSKKTNPINIFVSDINEYNKITGFLDATRAKKEKTKVNTTRTI